MNSYRIGGVTILQDYSIMKRKVGKNTYFYVKFKNLDTGLYGTAKSIESLRKQLGDTDFHHITKKLEAISIVQRAIDAGLNGKRKADMNLSEYLLDFWDWNKSQYIQKENKKRANSIGKTHASNMQKMISRYVVFDPVVDKGKKYARQYKFSRDLKCSQLKTSNLSTLQDYILNIEDYSRDSDGKCKIVKAPLSVKTWLHVQNSLSAPIKELLKIGILTKNPLDGLEKYSVSSTQTTRGSLSRIEVDSLIHQIKDDIENLRMNERIGFAIVLACATGMRMGEIRALRKSDIDIPEIGNLALIHISKSYSNMDGFKGTKTLKYRSVTVSKGLAMELCRLAEENLSGDDLIVWSDRDGRIPFSNTALERNFDKALERIGINKERKAERQLSFHSMRHYANTEGITRVGKEMTNLFIGHDSDAMAERYDHANDERAFLLGINLEA